MQTRCKHLGCSGYGVKPTGYCPTHAGEAPKPFAGASKISMTSAHYGKRGWSNFSRQFLARNPVCVLCGKPSECTDHYLMSATDMVKRYGEFILDPNLYRALCTPCNLKERHRRPPAGGRKRHKGEWTP